MYSLWDYTTLIRRKRSQNINITHQGTFKFAHQVTVYESNCKSDHWKPTAAETTAAPTTTNAPTDVTTGGPSTGSTTGMPITITHPTNFLLEGPTLSPSTSFIYFHGLTNSPTDPPTAGPMDAPTNMLTNAPTNTHTGATTPFDPMTGPIVIQRMITRLGLVH